MQRIFHSFTLLVSAALCGAIIGGVVASLLIDSVGVDAIATVLTGIAAGGGCGLVGAAAIALRASTESLKRYSRYSMILAILFLAMLLVRRYRMEKQMLESEIEIVPV